MTGPYRSSRGCAWNNPRPTPRPDTYRLERSPGPVMSRKPLVIGLLLSLPLWAIIIGVLL